MITNGHSQAVSSQVLIAVLCMSACSPDRPVETGGVEVYEATGTIVSIEGDYVLIDHDDIPGLMDAMTMTFSVSDPALLDGVGRGARVSFRVVVDGASYTIDQIASRAVVDPAQPR